MSRFVEDEVAVAIAVELEGRWDALALSEALIPYRSFLVQLDRERWVVHARVPGRRGQALDDALDAIDVWRLDRGLDEVSCRVGGEPCRLQDGGARFAGQLR